MLPFSLVDVLCERLSHHPNSLLNVQSRVHIRRVQQLAVQYAGAVRPGSQRLKIPRQPSEPDAREWRSLRVQQVDKQLQAVSELQERITALDGAPQPDQLESAPHFNEADLQNIYKDLLSVQDDTKAVERSEATEQKKLDIAHDLEERLSTFEDTLRAQAIGVGLSGKLLARRIPSNSAHQDDSKQPASVTQLTGDSPLRMVIARLQTALDTLQSLWSSAMDNTLPSKGLSVPLGLLSKIEWESLSQACLDADDALASETVLDLMKRSGFVPSDDQYDSILDWFSARGLVSDAESYMSRLAIEVLRERQRDLLVKARVKAGRLNDACALIHSFETRNFPAPMQSYTRVIQALLAQRGPGSEQQKAQAWDMFSHMRYVAHPVADRFLYNVMIRACAEFSNPEPERALDLFTEMTAEKNIPPTTFTYNGVILTCARSKKFALEAFRLAREMLNSHRDAHGAIPAHLQPDTTTFYALLEAAKRLRDLPRSRWILAQIIHYSQNTADGRQAICVDQKVMTHLFHAYASYRPPFHREAVALAPERGSEHAPSREAEDEQEPHVRDIKAFASRRPRGAPQSRQEVLKEVCVLWNRILEDRRAMEQWDNGSSEPPAFGRVSLTTSLLNAYLTVHYAHSPPSASYEVYNSLFDLLGIQRDGFSYVLALEAYASGKRLTDDELVVTLSYTNDIWKDWQQLEQAGIAQMSDSSTTSSGVDARLVERAWTAMIRVLTLNGKLDEALSLVHQFVERYPPTLVKKSSPIDPSRSMRTLLYAERPIVRLTEHSTVPEDRITPFLTFNNLELLHHRAVARNRADIIRYIKWAVRSYECSLRRRRLESARRTNAK